LTCLGIVTNLINVRVFHRQGVTSDSTTVVLFTLSLSDLLGCVFLVPEIFCFYAEGRVQTDNGFINNCTELTLMPATYTHLILIKISSFVTVYLSVERAICVVFPLRVKRIIRVKNTVTIMVLIYILLIISFLPYGVNVFVVWVADPNKNGSHKAINYATPEGKTFALTNSLFHSFTMSSLTMIVVTVSTVAIVTRLKASVKWRAASALGRCSGLKGFDRASVKKMETARIVLAIMSVYLMCLTFTHIPNMALVAIPGADLTGRNRFFAEVLYVLKFDFDSFNSSVHFFFYIRMSSKY
ncbi:unnamed protein product, partial [Lymnaea stagnalis]